MLHFYNVAYEQLHVTFLSHECLSHFWGVAFKKNIEKVWPKIMKMWSKLIEF